MTDLLKVKSYVCPVPSLKAEVDAIKQMVMTAGGSPICANEQDLSNAHACIDQCDVMFILICTETLAPAYQDLIAYASRTGKRVIGIWPEGAAVQDVPGMLGQEGDGAIPMTAEKIKDVIMEGEGVWELPGGVTRPLQKTPRHKG
jgi:hypothetical protein